MKNFLIVSFIFLFGVVSTFFYLSYLKIDKNDVPLAVFNTGVQVQTVKEIPINSGSVKMSVLADSGTYTEDYRNAHGKVVVPKGVKPTKDVVERMQRWASLGQ